MTENFDRDRELVVHVYAALDEMHAWRGWHWWPDGDPFEVIVGAILVQNTAWSNVERALDQLRAAEVLSPDAMTCLNDEELEALVRPSGQYRQKAKKLRTFLDLTRRHGGLDALLALPSAELREVLLATWGIGEETADAIVVYAARQPSVVIDAYTRRLFTRLGAGPVHTDRYGTWREWFGRHMPQAAHPHTERDVHARYHALIVMHCKHLCLKNRPRCGECALVERCPGSPARAAT